MTRENQPPEYFYDVSTGQVLVGKVALDIHIDEGNHPADIRPLGEVLRDPSIPLTENDSTQRLNTEGWTNEEYLQYGRWLVEVVRPPNQRRERAINRDSIVRAGQLGIGPILYEVISPKTFGNLRTYYQQLGLENVHRIENYERSFPDWSRSDFLRYLKRVSSKLGKKPTQEDLQSLYEENPESCPSPFLIETRFGTLSHALELIGYPNIKSWDESEYIAWGVRFMKANSGSLPRTSSLVQLSFKKVGPSDLTIRKKFGSISAYQRTIKQQFLAEIKREKDAREHQEELLQKTVETNPELAVVLSQYDDPEEKARVFAKYQVVNELGRDWTEETKLRLSMNGHSESGFVGSIRRLDKKLTVGEIESTAIYLGVFDTIWPPDDSYMDTLRLDVK